MFRWIYFLSSFYLIFFFASFFQNKNKIRLFYLLYSSQERMTTKKNFLLFKIKVLNDKDDFNINNFIDLFLDDGIFQPYLDEIFGIATHNYQLKIYNVTFKDTTPKKILEDLYNTFCEPEIISTKDNIDFSIQINPPQDFRQLITLYPMPFDISNENIQEIDMEKCKTL